MEDQAMKIDIVPVDGNWIIVKDFHMLEQHGPTAFSRSPGIPEWKVCWAGDRWAPTGELSVRFTSKAGAETYLDQHRESMEHSA
jgi:hypothetical protein